MPRPRVPFRLGTLDEEKFEFGGCPEDQRNSGLRVPVTGLGLGPVLRLAGETVHEATQPSVWDFHSNASGVRLPNMFVELRLESHRKPILENPVGQFEQSAGIPNG